MDVVMALTRMSQAYKPGQPAHIHPIGSLKLFSLKSSFVFVIKTRNLPMIFKSKSQYIAYNLKDTHLSQDKGKLAIPRRDVFTASIFLEDKYPMNHISLASFITRTEPFCVCYLMPMPMYVCLGWFHDTLCVCSPARFRVTRVSDQ